MKRETKALPFSYEIKEKEDGDWEFSGYAATFGGKPDSYGDVIQKGAFKKTIDERFPKNQIKILWQHDTRQPLGIPIKIYEDEVGLFVEGKITGTTFGKDVKKHVVAKVIDKMSIGYRTIIQEYNQETEIRTLKEVKLYEFSLVTFPANDNATIDSVKEENEMKEELKELTDLVKELTEKVKTLEDINCKALESENEPEDSTQEDVEPQEKTDDEVEQDDMANLADFLRN